MAAVPTLLRSSPSVRPAQVNADATVRYLRAGRLARVAGAVIALYGSAAHAGPVLDGIRATGIVKLCLWPGYHGMSFRDPRTGKLNGVDIDLAIELETRLGAKVVYVEAPIDKLVEQLEAHECDLAVPGAGMPAAQPQRVRLSEPYLRSSLYGVTTRTSALVRGWHDIDRPGVQVAVLGGTATASAMASRLRHARLMVVGAARSCEEEIETGRADVMMADGPYARRLLDHAEWARLVPPPQPFFTVAYAYAVRPDDEEWLRWINEFVARIKQDGSLGRAAARARLGDIVARE